MSGYTGIIDATPGFVAGTFDAKDVRLATLGNALPGLFASGHLAVTQRAAGANMSVDVGAGHCFVDPGAVAYQGVYLAQNTASYNTFSNGGYTWTASDPTNARIDLLCVEVADTDFSGSYTGWKLRIVDGTPSASATHQLEANLWPAVPAGCVPIAAIRVPATATTLTTANITNLNPIGGVGRAPSSYTVTAETTASTTYARLATPDVAMVYVPANAKLQVAFEGLWKVSVASGTQAAALFLNGVQLKHRPALNGAPVVNEVTVASLATVLGPVYTISSGMSGGAGLTADLTEVATGMTQLAAGSVTAAEIFGLPAGWYVAEMRYKTSANTLTVASRRMWAGVIG